MQTMPPSARRGRRQSLPVIGASAPLYTKTHRLSPRMACLPENDAVTPSTEQASWSAGEETTSSRSPSHHESSTDTSPLGRARIFSFPHMPTDLKNASVKQSESNWSRDQWSPRAPAASTLTPLEHVGVAEQAFLSSRQCDGYERLRAMRIHNGVVEDCGNCYKQADTATNKPPTVAPAPLGSGDNEEPLLICGAPPPRGRRHSTAVPMRATDRRSTCPDIWLSRAEALPPTASTCVHIDVCGDDKTGRSALIRQLVSEGGSVDGDTAVIAFLVNRREVRLHLHKVGDDDWAHELGADVDVRITVMMYSVTNKASFAYMSNHLRAHQAATCAHTKRAGFCARVVARVSQHMRAVHNHDVVVVGNKSDLQRTRKVSTQQGKTLARICECAFVETSATLGHDIDALLKQILLSVHEQQKRAVRDDAADTSTDGEHDDSPRLNSTASAPRSPSILRSVYYRSRRMARSCETMVNRCAHEFTAAGQQVVH